MNDSQARTKVTIGQRSNLPAYANNWNCFTDRNPEITSESKKKEPVKLTKRITSNKDVNGKRRALAIEVRKMRTGENPQTFKVIAAKLGISVSDAQRLNKQIANGEFTG